MVAKNSTDWLPAGWSVEHKVQNNGRKTVYYTNSETGQRFYSKNDVVRYLNMGNIHCNPPQLIDSQLSNTPQSIDSQLSKRSRKEPSQVVVEANKTPEWLPEGWIMELKTHKSGSNIGKEYKCYVDPSAARKFYSKPEVFQYLKSAKRESYSSQQKELGIDVHSREDNVVETKEFPEWLPKGWSVELKTRKLGQRLGTEYKCYVEPSTGNTFYSKPEVFRYLKSVKNDSVSPEHNDLNVRGHSTENGVVEANESPEWLPKGWVVELKTHKSGSKIGQKYKCYVDPSTGHKCFSKPEVFRLLTSAKHESCSSRQNGLSVGENSTENVVAESNESSEWLPQGWILEIKTHKDGSKIGKKYKCYIDPSTGHKCFSKPEVFRYLKSAKHDSRSSEQNGLSVGEHSTKNVVVEANESSEWLPEGWFVEMKTHKGGSKIGKKYKYYVDPSTGRKFLSKPQVFRYLKSVKRDSCYSKQKDLDAGEHSTENFQTDHSPESGTSQQNMTGNVKDMKHNLSSCKQKKESVGMPATNVSVEKVAPDGLPPGWVLEIKIKGKRRDPYYTDPVSGYVFRSRKDVFRYLETGEVSRHAFKPKNRSINDSEMITDGFFPPSAAETQVLSDRVTRRQLFAGNGNLEVGSDAKGTNISTRAFSKTMLVAVPTTESIQEKHPLEHITPGKGSSEVGILALPNAEATSIRRVTRAYAKTRLDAAPATESLQEKLPLKHTTANKGSSEVRNLALPNIEGTSVRRVTRGYAKNVLVSAPTTESLQEKHPVEQVLGTSVRRVTRGYAKNVLVSAPTTDSLQEKHPVEHIASGKESSEMSSLALPRAEGTIIRRATRGSTQSQLVFALATENIQNKNVLDKAMNKCVKTSEISDPSGSAFPEAKDLKRKRGKRVDARTKHVSTPAADILQEKKLMDYTTENPYPTKGSNRKQGKKGSVDNGSVPVPTADMLDKGKLQQNGMEKHISRRTQKNSSNIKNQKEINLTRRSSKRLAGLGSELVVDLKASEQAPQVAAARDNNEDILALDLVVDTVAQWASQPLVANPEFPASVGPENLLNEEPSIKSNMLPEDQKDHKEHGENLEAEKKDEGNPEFAHQASVGPGKSLDEEPSNTSNMPLPEGQNDLKEHVGNLEGEKKYEGNPEPQPSFAFGDSWADPCLEFAFKTLTGALPIEDDNQDVQDYFQHQSGISQIQRDHGLGVPELGLHNTFEIDDLFRCDSPVIPVSERQQLPVNPPLMPSSNISLPSHNEMGPQQPRGGEQ